MALVEQILVTIYLPSPQNSHIELDPSSIRHASASCDEEKTNSQQNLNSWYLSGVIGVIFHPKKTAWIRRLPYRSSSCIIRYHLWLLPADSLRKEQRLMAAASVVAVVDIFDSIWSSPFSTSCRFLFYPKKKFGPSDFQNRQPFGMLISTTFEHSPTWYVWNLIVKIIHNSKWRVKTAFKTLL